MRRTVLHRLFGRPIPVRKAKKAPQIEALESRYAPACSVTHFPAGTEIACDAANDTIDLRRDTTIWAVRVNGQDRGNAVAPIFNINGSGGTNTLSVFDARAVVRTITGSRVDGTSLIANYANIQGLTMTVSDPGAFGSRLDVQGTSAVTALILGPGNDTVRVLGTTGNLQVFGGAGNDTFNVGAPTIVLGPLQGQVELQGQAGVNTLNYNDQANPTPSLNYTLAASPTTRIQRNGLRDVLYSGMNAVVLNTAVSGSHAVNVLGTVANSDVTVNGGAGNDAFTVADAAGRLQVLGALTVNGGAGQNSLQANDGGATTASTYTVVAGALSRAGQRQVVYSGLAQVTLTGGSAGDTVNVLATGAGVRHLISPRGGNDAVNVGFIGSMLDIQGQVDVIGFTGTDTLHLANGAPAAPREYVFGVDGGFGTLDTPGLARVAYNGVENVTLLAGPGNDFIAVGPAAAGVALSLFVGGGDDVIYTTWLHTQPLTVNGAEGSDTLITDDTATTTAQTHTVTPTQVSRTGAGSVSYGTVEALALFTGSANQTVAFQGTGAAEYTYVAGGAGHDTFRLGNGSYAAPLYLDGGAGGNALDYSPRSSDVYANVATGEATNVAYFANVRDLSGGSGHDILVGNGYGNQLSGRGGDDLLIAGGWDYPFLPCVLDGGDGSDILIGGMTIYDFDRTSLQAILNGWRLPGDPFARAERLKTGAGGLPILNETTVFSNYGGNTLRGGTDFDFFFFNPDFGDVTDGDFEAEPFVRIIS